MLWELKRYNGIQEWIKYFIQLKEVEEKLSTYNTSEFLLPGEEEEYQQLLKEKQTLRKKTKNIIKVDELEVLLHNGMDEMQVDFIKDDISNKMSETKLGLRELFNEINLLKGKIKNVADFVKANYESLLSSPANPGKPLMHSLPILHNKNHALEERFVFPVQSTFVEPVLWTPVYLFPNNVHTQTSFRYHTIVEIISESSFSDIDCIQNSKDRRIRLMQ